MAGGSFGGGSGTSGDPYLVEDAADLNAVRNHRTSHFRQTRYIDLTSYADWLPIGDYDNRFKGSYNGAGFVIEKLKITNNPTPNNIGLFGYVEFASITMVTLTDVDIQHDPLGNYDNAGHVGALVGNAAASTISKCSTAGVILNIGSRTGGLIGVSMQSCVIAECFSLCRVTGRRSIGGIVGEAYNTSISNCYSTGDISGLIRVAGIAGYLSPATIDKCYSAGGITVTSEIAGGIAGDFATSLTKFIKNSFALNKKIKSSSLNTEIGRIYSGISGTGTTAIENNKALKGMIYDSPDGEAEIFPNFNPVSGGKDGTDLDATTAKTATPYSGTGWDFVNIWRISPFRNSGYPYLAW